MSVYREKCINCGGTGYKNPLDTDTLMWERWEKQFKEIRKSNPICKCGEVMEWYKSDTYGYYYRCSICGKKKRRKYYHEFYTDEKGRRHLRRVKRCQ